VGGDTDCSRDGPDRDRTCDLWLPHPNFPIGTLSGYAGAFILVSARQTLPMSSASTAGQFDGDSTSSNEPTPNAPGTWPRSASVVKPLARSGNCWNARAMLRLRLRSSKPSEPSEPKRGDKSPMPTSNGSTLRRTCQVVLVLRQLVSYESAIPMALVVSGSSAPRLRPYSTTAGCSTNEGPNLIVKTSGAAISTQRLLIVSTTSVSFRAAKRIALPVANARKGSTRSGAGRFRSGADRQLRRSASFQGAGRAAGVRRGST